MSIVSPEICLIYTKILKDHPFKNLRISVHYVARGSELRALKRPRESHIVIRKHFLQSRVGRLIKSQKKLCRLNIPYRDDLDP